MDMFLVPLPVAILFQASTLILMLVLFLPGKIKHETHLMTGQFLRKLYLSGSNVTRLGITHLRARFSASKPFNSGDNYLSVKDSRFLSSHMAG